MKNSENSNEFSIPKTPEKREPQVQTEEERNQRLKEWETLLSDIPNCEIAKAEEDVSDGFIEDNDEIFENSIFVISTGPDLNYHPSAYMIIYFMFENDGKVRIQDEGNYLHCPDLADPVVERFKEIYEENSPTIAESWSEGYEEIIKIIEYAFGRGIPSVPKNE